MADQSELDQKYFIDSDTYNCPFCNRHSIVYTVESYNSFNWSNDRLVYIYRVKCNGCDGVSLHLSDFNFSRGYDPKFSRVPSDQSGASVEGFEEESLDNYFFYHQPTSFFTVNELIPKKIRELVSEADGCRKMDYLVGASGALRKAIYELLLYQKAEGESYEDKIKWLKSKHSNIFAEYFDALSNIQDMTSENLHEKDGSWEPWIAEEFDYLLEALRALLDELYVKPDMRRQMLSKITDLKSKWTLKNKRK